ELRDEMVVDVDPALGRRGGALPGRLRHRSPHAGAGGGAKTERRRAGGKKPTPGGRVANEVVCRGARRLATCTGTEESSLGAHSLPHDRRAASLIAAGGTSVHGRWSNFSISIMQNFLDFEGMGLMWGRAAVICLVWGRIGRRSLAVEPLVGTRVGSL